jgi:hypothetical protein
MILAAVAAQMHEAFSPRRSTLTMRSSQLQRRRRKRAKPNPFVLARPMRTARSADEGEERK